MKETDYWAIYLKNATEDRRLREEYSSALVDLGAAKLNGDIYDISYASIMANISFNVLLEFTINRINFFGDNPPELKRI